MVCQSLLLLMFDTKEQLLGRIQAAPRINREEGIEV